MGTVLIILIIIFLVFPLVRGPLSRWFSGFMARRTEDMVRRMMGMPSRKEEKKRRKKAAEGGSRFSGGRRRSGAASRDRERHPAAMMQPVAVDVEYTEIREFESRTTISDDGQSMRIVTEEQVSDAEYVEIRI